MNLKNKLYISMLAAPVFFMACKKDAAPLPSPLPASVTVVNAAVDLGSVQVNAFTDGLIYANLNDSITSLASEHYTFPSGARSLKVVPRSDTTRTVVDGRFSLAPGAIYSLYIAGQAPKYDTMMVAESRIPTYTDSAIGVRLVNLATGSPAVSMSLDAGPGAPDAAGIGYRQQSGFIKYPLPANADYATTTYDVRDPGDVLLASYTLPGFAFYPYTTPSVRLARFRAITLVLTGTAAAGYQIFAVTNY